MSQPDLITRTSQGILNLSPSDLWPIDQGLLPMANFVCVVISHKHQIFYQAVYLDICLSLQTFAIPGSIFLSILSGYLYPFPLALFLVCLVSKNILMND